MAKTKTDLLSAAKAAGLVAEDTEESAISVDELKDLLAPPGARPAWHGSLSASEELVAPDGHVVLSQADLDARDA